MKVNTVSKLFLNKYLVVGLLVVDERKKATIFKTAFVMVMFNID